MTTGILIGIATLIAWVLWAFFGFKLGLWLSNGSELGAAGQWGDTFGAFNALISGCGFVAVILTLRSQSKALQIQQNALKQQQMDLHRQQFDSTFFELLKLLRECRDQFKYKRLLIDEHAEGIPAFSLSIHDLNHGIKGKPEQFGIKESSYIELYIPIIHRRYEPTLSPYFRIIYRILERLRRDNILTIDEKTSYAKLLRGQLSSSELAIIGLNAKQDFANDCSELIARFRMLKYLPKGAIRDELEKCYPLETFIGHGD